MLQPVNYRKVVPGGLSEEGVKIVTADVGGEAHRTATGAGRCSGVGPAWSSVYLPGLVQPAVFSLFIWSSPKMTSHPSPCKICLCLSCFLIQLIVLEATLEL